MAYKLLFVLIEGNDDERFFNRILKTKLEEKYSAVSFYKHANVQNKKISNFLRSIKAMDADYIYVEDIDSVPCVTAKKRKIQDKVDCLDGDKIMVVIREIESWYLAGLDGSGSKELGIKSFSVTNNLTKDHFNHLIPNQFDSRIDFMMEILNNFQIEVATQKNESFKYFFEKHNFDVC